MQKRRKHFFLEFIGKNTILFVRELIFLKAKIRIWFQSKSCNFQWKLFFFQQKFDICKKKKKSKKRIKISFSSVLNFLFSFSFSVFDTAQKKIYAFTIIQLCIFKRITFSFFFFSSSLIFLSLYMYLSNLFLYYTAEEPLTITIVDIFLILTHTLTIY